MKDQSNQREGQRNDQHTALQEASKANGDRAAAFLHDVDEFVPGKIRNL